MTLRQILARIQCLPEDSPLQMLLAYQREQDVIRREDHKIDVALAPFSKG